MLRNSTICTTNIRFRPIQPILLSLLIQLFIEVENGTAKISNFKTMCLYGVLILIITLLSIFIGHHSDVILSQVGMRVRIACCSLIYRKVVQAKYSQYLPFLLYEF